ncbi:phosphatase PAP2 family protein [Mucilaginibacter ginsenosidivorax]|jgi:membrane-associated phospholipid phosphatase|uniref:Phosphatase PAP2 family protein n=1 Tax=Mucilaginibacter ginsenosidivorax TaxID=862126 RepID=A0A5B8W3M8_9SPHI|nr:phosphatase PAP2 family protein [Mucilaginibacter ginsenosidivorax]QEC78139.1 phosphatase PAP2 family protein [Mucilaginibacter ginsenosidivorax]
MKIGVQDVLYRIRPFFLLYLIVLCACLVIKLLYTREQIFFAVNGWNSPWADYIEPYMTDLGDGLTAVTLSLVFLLFSYRKFLLLASSYLLTGFVAQVIKYFADAPRPSLYFKDQWAPVHTVKGVEILTYNSFPSGHTTSAFSAAVVLAYLATKKGWGIPALLMAILIGYSRMYLTEHFFEDVIGGSAIGVIVTVLWLTWLENKQFIHSEKWRTGLIKTVFK